MKINRSSYQNFVNVYQYCKLFSFAITAVPLSWHPMQNEDCKPKSVNIGPSSWHVLTQIKVEHSPTSPVTAMQEDLKIGDMLLYHACCNAVLNVVVLFENSLWKLFNIKCEHFSFMSLKLPPWYFQWWCHRGAWGIPPWQFC